jgi:hypothetical protein
MRNVHLSDFLLKPSTKKLMCLKFEDVIFEVMWYILLQKRSAMKVPKYTFLMFIYLFNYNTWKNIIEASSLP